MKTFLIYSLFFMQFLNCTAQNKEKVHIIYENIKNHDLSIFINWNVYIREGLENTYLFDYTDSIEVKERYVVLEMEEVKFKKITSDKDTGFYNLSEDTTLHQLYSKFKALSVDGIFWKQSNRLFYLKKDNLTLVYQPVAYEQKPKGEQFKNLVKIDANWYYFKKD